MITTAYKVLTHDLRSLIQGGEPIFDGKLPFTLPRVVMDRSQKECSAGWDACADAHTALRNAGLWPNGRPSRLFRAETDIKVLKRNETLRAEEWTLVEEITDLTSAIQELSKPFTPFVDEMVIEQLAWRKALRHPFADLQVVKKGLQDALDARALTWQLKQFASAQAAWAAQDAWATQDAWDAWDAWAAWAAWAAQDAWDARDAWATQDARATQDAWDAWDAWDARDAWATQDARAALTFFFAAKQDWIKPRVDLLTVGIRDAYLYGLEIAIPTGPNELGWAMKG
jgi:hypothetical protein